MVVQCTSAGQLAGPRIISGLLLLKTRNVTDKNACMATSDTPQKFIEVTPLTESLLNPAELLKVR